MQLKLGIIIISVFVCVYLQINKEPVSQFKTYTHECHVPLKIIRCQNNPFFKQQKLVVGRSNWSNRFTTRTALHVDQQQTNKLLTSKPMHPLNISSAVTNALRSKK